MALFRYRACNDAGEMVSGEERAESQSHLLRSLQSKRLYPVQVNQVDKQPAASTVEETIAWHMPVPRQRLADLFDQLATLLDAGIPIIDALRGVMEQQSNVRLRAAMKKVSRLVEDGAPLHVAMESVPHVFDETSVRVVQAGEHSGKLVPVLIRLSQTIEFDLQIRNRFREATRYPKMVVGTLIIAAALLMTFVVPKYATLFSKANVELPLMTKVLMGSGNLIRGYWPLLICAALLAYSSLRALAANRDLAKWFDRMRMRIPIWGALRFKIEVSRVFKILSLLIESGVNILSAFQLASAVSRNRLLAGAFARVREKLEAGESLTSSLADIPLFPKAARQMIILGERAGRLDESLDKIAQMYERESLTAIKRMHSMIEPTLIVAIGGVVIVFALSIFLPMWDLLKVVK